MHSNDPERPILGIIGGTGPEGRGLATRFAVAGFPVVIGSRSAERGAQAAEEVRRELGDGLIIGRDNERCAADADIALLTIPYAGVEDTLRPLGDALRGKIVVSAIAPVEFQEGRPVALRVPAGSAAEEVQRLLPGSRVVSGFQTVDAHNLLDLDAHIDTDVLICSDDVEARRTVVRLANELPGVRGLSAGRLAASRYVEACTALLITVNRIYKVHSGIKLTGINR